MKLAIVTNTVHYEYNDKYYTHGPYIREINIWENFSNSLIIVAPTKKSAPPALDLPYKSDKINIISLNSFNLLGFKNIIKTIFLMPLFFLKIYQAFSKAEHIHLRCPCNFGLIGSVVQIFFPKKNKTAKYAGNWDWNSNQPWSYRLQQRILRNTMITKNMTVLVYGDWPDKTKNTKSFFTASYSEKDRMVIPKRMIKPTIHLLFAGNLSKGKNPIIALHVLNKLIKQGHDARLVFCGEGNELYNLKTYIKNNNLEKNVEILGSIDPECMKKEYQRAHFLIFASNSEGWPKVVAEAMWWGCIPITTKVSCIPEMLGYGQRGILVNPNSDEIAERILDLKNRPLKMDQLRNDAITWSWEFTLEKFENQIKGLLRV